MIFESFPVGPFRCNCVVLGDEISREGVVVDPGDEPEAIDEVLDQHRLDVKSVILTHGHIDHILAAEHVRRTRGAAVCIHEGDRFLWDGVQMQASFLGMRAEPAGAIDRYLADGETIAFGSHRLRVIETPGHTPGSICLLLEGSDAMPLLLSGDTLFQRGIGRTDLWGGSTEGILRSIHERLFCLDEETIVHPGHGPVTSIRDEKRSNPFL